MTTVGVWTAAAMWAMPESLPTNRLALDASAVISGNVRSSNIVTGTFDSRFRFSRTSLSFFDATANVWRPISARNSVVRAKFSVGHCLVANADDGCSSANLPSSYPPLTQAVLTCPHQPAEAPPVTPERANNSRPQTADRSPPYYAQRAENLTPR